MKFHWLPLYWGGNRGMDGQKDIIKDLQTKPKLSAGLDTIRVKLQSICCVVTWVTKLKKRDHLNHTVTTTQTTVTTTATHYYYSNYDNICVMSSMAVRTVGENNPNNVMRVIPAWEVTFLSGSDRVALWSLKVMAIYNRKDLIKETVQLNCGKCRKLCFWSPLTHTREWKTQYLSLQT